MAKHEDNVPAFVKESSTAGKSVDEVQKDMHAARMADTKAKERQTMDALADAFLEQDGDSDDHGQGDGARARQEAQEIEEGTRERDGEMEEALAEMLGKKPPSEDGDDAPAGDDGEVELDEDGEPVEADPDSTGARTREELLEALGDATYTVKAHGEDIEVTAEELVDGYSRTADWTRGKQEVAAQRNQLNTEAEVLREQGFKYAERMETLEHVMAATGANPELVQQVKAEQQRVMAVLEQDMQAQRQAKLAQQADLLVEALPDFNKKAVAEHAMSEFGMTAEDLSGLEDYRAIILLDRSRRLAELEAKMGTAQDAVRGKIKKSKTLRPGPMNRAKDRAKQRDRDGKKARRDSLRKTGHRDDATRALMDWIGDDI